ncbi:MAG: hypothetical protein HRT45_19515, partial [Bdellovibrionales bacterium]|nr:hypothetical protein [Bdellovibrionales bacterium]
QLLGVYSAYGGYQGLQRFFAIEPDEDDLDKETASPHLLARIRRFLATNSVGEGAWQVSDLQNITPHFANIQKLNLVDSRDLSHNLMLLGSLSSVTFDLASISNSPWPRYIEKALAPENLLDKTEPEFGTVYETLKLLDNFDSNPQVEEYRSRWIEALGQITLEQATQSRESSSGFSLLANSIMPRTMSGGATYNVDVTDFFKSVQQALTPVVAQFQNGRYNEIQNASQNSEAGERVKSLSYVLDLYSDFKVEVFSQQELLELDQAMAKLVLDIGRDKASLMNAEVGNLLLGPNGFSWFSRVLSSDYLSKDEKFEFLKTTNFLLGGLSAYVPGNGPQAEESRGLVKAFFQSLSSEELFEALTFNMAEIEQDLKPWVDRVRLYYPIPGMKEYSQLQNPELGAEFKAWVEKQDWSIEPQEAGRLSEALWGASLNTFKLIQEVGFEDLNVSPHMLSQLLYFMRAKIAESRKTATLFESFTMVDMMLRRESYGFLVTNVIKNFEEKQNLERLIFDLQTLQAVSDTEVQSMLDWEQKLMLSRVISEHLRPMRASQRARWLDKKIVFDSLTSDDLTELVMQTIRSSISRNAPLAHIAEQTQHFMNRYDLKDERPETYAELRSLIAEHFQVQPSEISTVFPDDERSITEQASEYSGHIRGMSALVNLARKQSPEDQLELIEFLMGRQQETPGFVFEITKYGDEKLDPEQLQSVINLLATVRFRLENQTEDRRAFVVNSILTGGSPLISDPEQNQLLRNRILGHVSEDKKPMANLIIDALTRAEGTTISLYYSYALAQKPSGEDKVLSEADVFQALLIPFEVPGIKLMQYLGFSKTFEEYSESFEEAQDNANPLNYYDALNLVALRYGEKWADNHIITDMKGFGSVNVALSYYNIETGETGEITFAREEIVNLARKDIRIRSKEAFRRFKAALEALIELQEHDGQFDMLVGLLQLIEDSVALEFDKENFVEMQNNAGSIYSGPATRGWTLKTVPVFDRFELSVRMGIAKGRPAKKVERENPELYAEAMTAFLMAEFEHLIGGSDVDDKLMFANPDIHNGQLFIDEESRTVTVIDFGQATSINDQQR